MNNSLSVLYQSNDAYAMVTGVSIASFCENNQHFDNIHFYLINDDISESNLEKIDAICKHYKRDFDIVDSTSIKNKLIELGVEPWRGTYTTYFKMLAVDNIEAPTDLLLQIDGDTIINKKLDDLANFEIGDNICAATYDTILPEYKTRLGIPTTDYYYNCGIMLISRSNWKDHQCTKRILDHLQNVRSRYFIVDQDILNILFRNEMTYFDISYNFNSCFYIYGIENSLRIHDLNDDNYTRKARIEVVMEEGPAINHCMGAMTGRPWEKKSIHPQNDLFDKYLSLTEWDQSDKVEKKRSLIFKAQRIAYQILPLGIYWRIHKYALRNWIQKQDDKMQKEHEGLFKGPRS